MSAPVILYVEDEPNDVLLMQFAFSRAKLKNSLQIAKNGQEAKDYLAGTGCFSDRVQYPIPCLVLLDLNLPLVPGLEVLSWIREHPELTSLPVIVYSSSGQKRDVDEAEFLGIHEFIVKKSSVGAIAAMLQQLIDRGLV